MYDLNEFNFELFRKTFGSTWIRKVKKAGTELMNKVIKCVY